MEEIPSNTKEIDTNSHSPSSHEEDIGRPSDSTYNTLKIKYLTFSGPN